MLVILQDGQNDVYVEDKTSQRREKKRYVNQKAILKVRRKKK